MRTGFLWLTVLLAGTTAAQAGNFRKDQVPATAKWVMHADCDAVKGTQMGAYLLEKMQSEKANNKLAAVQAMFNFDPRKDLNGLTVFGEKQGRQDGVALVYGNFDEQRLVTLLKANDTYQAEAFGSRTIHSWVDPQSEGDDAGGPRVYGCVAGKGLVVIGGSIDNVKAALDVVDGRKPSMKESSALTDLLPDPSTMFFAAGTSLKDMGALSAVGASVAGGSLAVLENGGVLKGAVELRATDAQTGEQVETLVRGLIAGAMLNGQKNPAMARLAENVVVTVDGAKIKLSLTFPATDLIKLISRERTPPPDAGARE